MCPERSTNSQQALSRPSEMITLNEDSLIQMRERGRVRVCDVFKYCVESLNKYE